VLTATPDLRGGSDAYSNTICDSGRLPTMTVAGDFAAWALELRLDDIPEDVQAAACRQLLDGIGCAVAAVRGDAAPYATSVATALGAAATASTPGFATIIGDGRRAPAVAAAFANGVLVHALDFDDTHAGGLVHATAAVLPTAFAAGEERVADGQEVLTAAVAGYELVCRLGAAVPHGFHARGFHATSVCGVFASALVSARLSGLDVDLVVNALGIAGSCASGSLEFLHTGATTKQLHPGLAALNGMVAVRLATDGAEGPGSIFEGEYGLFRTYLGVDVDAKRLTDDLGNRWETREITIKPYPVCQLSHAALDALRCLLPLDGTTIDEIRFRVHTDSTPIVLEPANLKVRPRSSYEAKFSLPWCAAALVVDGDLTIHSFEPERLTQEPVRRLAARVSYEEASYGGVPADAPGDVTVTLSDGRKLEASVEVSRGHPRNPMTEEDVIGKLAGATGLSSGRVETLAGLALGLSAQPTLEPLLTATRYPT